jgi:putative restriction endonuclease
MAVSRHRKSDLYERIIQSINDDGWNVLYLSDPAFHPLRLKIYRENERYILRVYIWNLTHGGGQARPADEYRIQITGVDHFEIEPEGKTLILGWWAEGSVFAGFDFLKHSGALGFSPSIQIREEALRRAAVKGFSPWIKDNQEIAIAFHPDFFVEYVRNIESLHSFGESKTDLGVLEEVIERPNQVNDALLEAVTQERQITVFNVRKKIRDNSFKARVLTSYRYRCAICGLQLKLVEAAHIIPVEHDGSDQTSNGIALCVLHHRAFDKALITVNDGYQIIYSTSKMEKFREIGLDGGTAEFIHNLRAVIHLPPAIDDRPHIDFLRQANLIRGWTQ